MINSSSKTFEGHNKHFKPYFAFSCEATKNCPWTLPDSESSEVYMHLFAPKKENWLRFNPIVVQMN